LQTKGGVLHFTETERKKIKRQEKGAVALRRKKEPLKKRHARPGKGARA